MVRVAVRPAFALIPALSIACLVAACERPGCENATLCVEQCFTPVFRQCSGCPAGSFPEELCDRQTVCVRELDRPGGTCDAASCTEGENGRCIVAPSGELCTYDECASDGDCAMGSLCACNAGLLEANVCVPASCGAPEDCGDYPCSPVPGCGGPTDPENGGPVSLACHGPDDECFTDRQCPEGSFCTMGSAGRWECAEPSCG
jgi:hypothetical protein